MQSERAMLLDLVVLLYVRQQLPCKVASGLQILKLLLPVLLEDADPSQGTGEGEQASSSSSHTCIGSMLLGR